MKNPTLTDILHVVLDEVGIPRINNAEAIASEDFTLLERVGILVAQRTAAIASEVHLRGIHRSNQERIRTLEERIERMESEAQRRDLAQPNNTRLVYDHLDHAMTGLDALLGDAEPGSVRTAVVDARHHTSVAWANVARLLGVL